MTRPASIAVLTVTLDHVEPKVVRRLVVPLKLRLDRLHLVLQAAFGWTNSHLYEFRLRGISWGQPHPDFMPDVLDAAKCTLLGLIEDTGVKTFKYVYDFGDDWEHTIKVGRIEPAIPGLLYPILVEAEGRTPPEDVGGYPGYAGFLEAINDPSHEQHRELATWIGEPAFDPHDLDIEPIDAELLRYAKRWASRTKAP